MIQIGHCASNSGTLAMIAVANPNPPLTSIGIQLAMFDFDGEGSTSRRRRFCSRNSFISSFRCSASATVGQSRCSSVRKCMRGSNGRIFH